MLLHRLSSLWEAFTSNYIYIFSLELITLFLETPILARLIILRFFAPRKQDLRVKVLQYLQCMYPVAYMSKTNEDLQCHEAGRLS